MTVYPADLEEIRGFLAKQMAMISRSHNSRLEEVVKLVRRERFLPPGPWKIQLDSGYIDTPSANPAYIYQNVVVALDAEKGINNGEPLLHARWIGAVQPEAGETVTHVGAGTGFYTAILSMLVQPGGRVMGFEVEADLARRAAQNVKPFENISVVAADAASSELPPSDVIYVNAGVFAPPQHWLAALRPGGRLIFPWRPTQTIGIAVLVTQQASGFVLRPLMPAWFIACVGTEGVSGRSSLAPDHNTAWQSRSIHLCSDRKPDDSATAIYDQVWFSREAVA